MSERAPLSYAQRVAAWDGSLDAVRAVLRSDGLREVTTPVRLRAVAVEPFIEPMAATSAVLATSPELPMKQLLCRGSGPIFQIAPCFRAAERGDWHREEFHLVEWYRVDHDTPSLRADVERLVDAVFDRVAMVLDEPDAPRAPTQWRSVGLLELIERTLGVRLRGDENAAQLRESLRDVSALGRDPLVEFLDARLARSPRARDLAAWTSFFSVWSHARLDPWLAAQSEGGIHVVDFPPALAALSACSVGPTGGRKAHRFESHVFGRELANGYRELRDPDEQRRRFDDVNALRTALDQPPLAVDRGFLDTLRQPGLPRCAGAALGLDRLVLLATGRRRLADVVIDLGAPSSAP